LKHLEREIKKNEPELKKVFFSTIYLTCHLNIFYLLQLEANHVNLQEQIAALSSTIDAAEVDIFRDFCRRINVFNIREYEERQLKVSQEESKARLQFETQISRLTHQYASSTVLTAPS